MTTELTGGRKFTEFMAKIRTGVVISNKMDKTAVVKIDRMVPHARYGKPVRVSQNFAVHDADNSVKIGDTVTIRETSPISKTKQWEIISTEPGTKGTKKTIKKTLPTDNDSPHSEVEEQV